jgi:DNA-binding GntR family transcriptional regulator
MQTGPGVIHEQLLDNLRDMIVEGELAGGARVSERDLCARFGVSRTPLREALKVLAAEGLVELSPNRGARVTRVSVADVDHTREIIRALEGVASERVCLRITDAELAEIRALHFQMMVHYERRERRAYSKANQAIHEAIMAASGNHVLAQTYKLLSSRIRRARYPANLDPMRWSVAVAEHDEILAALEARDGKRLARALQAHLDGGPYLHPTEHDAAPGKARHVSP